MYEQLKFKDVIYCKQDSVMVYNLKYEIFAGKILKIINIKDSYGSYVPLFKIQWYHIIYKNSIRYYTKYDFNVPSPYNSCLSENELFLSNQKVYLPIDRIIRKIQVLKLSEYEKMDEE